MKFDNDLSRYCAALDKKALTEHVDSGLLKAYNTGWNDCLWGDDAPALDAQTETEILHRVKTEPEKKFRNSKWERITRPERVALPTRLHEKYQKAIRFAGDKHLDQKMPSSEASYIVHISNVAMEIMLAYFAAPDFDVEFAVQMALLHDVLEDTPTPYNEMREEFGERIAQGVLALSKNQEVGGKREQMQDSLNRIIPLEKEVGMVKLADRITNLQSPPKHWTKEKIKRYQAEAKCIFDTLKHCNNTLALRMELLIETYQRYF